jgi:hypothetical protein
MLGHTTSRSHSKHSRRSKDRQAGRRRRNTQSGRGERNVSLEQLEGRTLFSVLAINGTAANDYISLAGSGGVLMQVDVNGVITHYNPNDYTSVTIDGVSGNDTINILGTELPVTVNGRGHDTVTVGDTNGVQDITQPVNVSDVTFPPSYLDLTVDDSPDAVGRNATISDSSITNLAPAAISYTAQNLSSLTVNGGGGGNTFTVTNTPAGFNLSNTPTNLNSGTGVDHVNVQGTASATTLNLQGQNGGDVVNVGNAGSVQGINGTINIQNDFSFDALTIDDSADATSRTAALNSFTPTGDGAWEDLSGLAPALINYEVGDVNLTTINGGTGGNTFNVNSLADGSGPVNLNTGTGADQVNIRTTDAGSTLNLQGQDSFDSVNLTNGASVQGIQGTVNIENTSSFDALMIDDSADATSRTATLSTFTPVGDSAWENLTGLAPGTINYELGDINAATIYGGSGGNTFNVTLGTGSGTMNLGSGAGADHVNILATATGSTLNLQGQNGLDSVNVGNAGSVQGIQGAVNIENTTQADALTIDDSADATARTVTLSSFTPAGDSAWEGITGLAPAVINYEVGDVTSATINGGTGGNTFNVNSLAAGIGSTFLNTGTGNDAVNIRSTDAGTTLSVDGQNGNDSVYLTNAGSVQAIQGTVNIENAGGFDMLTIDDSADTTARNATLDSFMPAADSAWESVTGMAPGAINYELADMYSATIDGGSGGNTFNVNYVGPEGVINLNTGTGTDHVNILATAGGTTLSVQGQSSLDTVSVTNAGSVLGILGTVNIENTGSIDALTIDDSADTTARTATLSTFTPSGDTPWESLTGLAPGTISYELADMNTTSIVGGSGGNTFNVTGLGFGGGAMNLNSGAGLDHVNIQGTAASTILNLEGGGSADVVNVGNAGSVQGVLGTVNIENSPISGFSALTIDDSADATGRTATLSTFTPPADAIWGRVSGLAPGVINYESADLANPITIYGGSGGNTFNIPGIVNTTDLYSGAGTDHVNILATPAGSVLNLEGQMGNDTVNVGNAGSVQGIFGTVNIENTHAYDTLTIDDSADPTPRNATLSTSTPAGDGPWESLTGLAPGTINLEVGDVNSTAINDGTGGNTFNINGTAAGGGSNLLTLNSNGSDIINVHSTASATVLNINALAGSDTVNLDFTSGNPLPHLVNLSGVFNINGLIAGDNLNGTTLDIDRSTLFIHYGSVASDPLALIQSYLKTGYNGGAWTGMATALTGAINSEPAGANPNHNTGIGYADWADGQGVNTVANTIELKYTLYGDANLDGQVNSADLQRLLANFNTPGTWDKGDFNYDGGVNSADLQALLANFNTVLGSQAAPAVDSAAQASAPPVSQSKGLPLPTALAGVVPATQTQTTLPEPRRGGKHR